MRYGFEFVAFMLCSSIVFTPVATPQARAADAPNDKGFAELAKKVSPGVVNISTYARPMMAPGRPGMMYGDDPFRKFFEDFFGGRVMPPNSRGGPGMQGPGGSGDDDDEGSGAPPPQAQRGRKAQKTVPFALGTGFVIDAKEGLILTNHHVIQGAEEVKVQFKEEDSELIPAEVVGRDPELDIALLKVKVKVPLVAIPLGDSDAIDVGEYVLAVGNPLGYGHTVTHGILSAKGRRNPEFRMGKYLQTDASINPGNSGGPLINMKGEVIGINNAIDARGQAIGFAIPINSVKNVLPQLRTKGSVTRGFLGVSAADLTADVAEQLKVDPKLRGVVVADVGPGTPAAAAGLKPYDIITSVNGVAVSSAADLTLQIVSIPVGGKAEIKYVRAGKERTAAAKVAERPLNGVARRQTPRGGEDESKTKEKSFNEFGFEAVDVTAQNARELGIPWSAIKGAKVVAVSDLEYGKPAASAGLSRGDIILDVAGKTVKSVVDLGAALSASKGKSILFRIKRFDPQGNSTVSVVVIGQ